MKFEQSLMTSSINTEVTDILAMSQPHFNGSQLNDYDSFLQKLMRFHSPSFDSSLANAISNGNEPIFDLMDVTVQLDTKEQTTEAVLPSREQSAFSME
ncbi:hypothetical protein KW429_11040 [Vibrio fluvialis]|nr:hypothetical protein [Vibrio fluvialis]MBY7902388.1 hypothetical protein [Vibrio fluvialis]